MVMNLMFWLGKQAPVEYTIKYYKEITTKVFAKITAKVESNAISVNVKTNKVVINEKSARIKPNNKLNVTLNIKPHANN